MSADARLSAVVAIFARAPELGKVKTRLAGSVGEPIALEAHRALLTRTIEIVALSGSAAEIWLDGDPDTLPVPRFPIRPQCTGDLGSRMLHTIADITARGHAAIIVGSDCPIIDEQYLRDAVQALARADLVIGPVEDGGYVLIGMSRPHDCLFVDMTWSTARVFAETLWRAERAGLTTAVLGELWDVDDSAGWRRWQALARSVTPTPQSS